MLKKLLKYEFRATGRVYGGLYLGLFWPLPPLWVRPFRCLPCWSTLLPLPC